MLHTVLQISLHNTYKGFSYFLEKLDTAAKEILYNSSKSLRPVFAEGLPPNLTKKNIYCKFRCYGIFNYLAKMTHSFNYG